MKIVAGQPMQRSQIQLFEYRKYSQRFVSANRFILSFNNGVVGLKIETENKFFEKTMKTSMGLEEIWNTFDRNSTEIRKNFNKILE